MRRLSAFLAVAVMLARPASARADDYREWISHCTTGTFKACFSVQITFVHHVAEGYYLDGRDLHTTRVDMRVVNLQGSTDWLPDSGPYSMDYVQLQGLGVSNWPAGVAAAGGLATVTANDGAGPLVGTNGWRPEWTRSIGATDGSLTPMFSNPPGFAPVYGCDLPNIDFAAMNWRGWQTCNGSITVGFTIPGTWGFTDGTTALVNIPGATFCEVGVCTVQVTPEPVTIALMGTGLAGLGGAALRRRKKNLET